ncbi:alpha/beta hydrolase fold domain-containing protein [Dokdonia ponticola]|uniref:Alpha/beta hydrolase fold domain-containing protein n=1 Tax=Dokdonia ponticola TaxID=2041041 RepID=A0ABV9HYW8_9FLAO
MLKQSFTYYLTLAVIKLKGLKQKFSQDPIDYKAIRKEDVHHPRGRFFRNNITREFQIFESSITEVSTNTESNKLIMFIHGGAFISGPGQHHWDTIRTIAQETEYTIWMCNYPKAPEHKISEISTNIDTIYQEAQKHFSPKKIVCIGDSVGGTLIAALTQRLIAGNKALPKQLILVSPVMDASLSNEDIAAYDKVDPMLSIKGISSAKRMCAGETSLKNPMISPIYGSFKSFPETILFLSENDIMYPDQMLTINLLKKENVHHKVIIGKSMPHIWPFLPVMKEAKIALRQIIKLLNVS